MTREESLKHGLRVFVDKAPPHLLSHQNKKRPNMSDSTPVSQSIGSSNICPTNARNGNYNEFGLHPTSMGDSSSFLLPRENIYNGILSSTISKTSITSCSSCKEGASHKGVYACVHSTGAPRVPNQNPSEHMRSLLKKGASSRLNSRKQGYQYQCSYPKGNEQVFLLSYQRSQHTNNISRISRAKATLSHILDNFFQPPPPSSLIGKRPYTRNPIQSVFHKPSSNVDDIGPWCKLETDQLLTLVQSMGLPKFLATSNELLWLESSLYDPLYSTSAHIPIHGTTTSYEPNLLLGIGNGCGIDKGKSKEVCSYWDLDDMVEMMESMKKRRKVTKSTNA
ncbi:hypothetical protein BS78_03G048600 [Paspalum vaginatum]|nr:hypothetical protein BS78_03G048600 [Paspalum vaginatum]